MDLLRRIRWGNLARLVAVAAAVALVAAWPRLQPAPPEVPAAEVEPVVPGGGAREEAVGEELAALRDAGPPEAAAERPERAGAGDAAGEVERAGARRRAHARWGRGRRGRAGWQRARRGTARRAGPSAPADAAGRAARPGRRGRSRGPAVRRPAVVGAAVGASDGVGAGAAAKAGAAARAVPSRGAGAGAGPPAPAPRAAATEEFAGL